MDSETNCVSRYEGRHPAAIVCGHDTAKKSQLWKVQTKCTTGPNRGCYIWPTPRALRVEGLTTEQVPLRFRIGNPVQVLVDGGWANGKIIAVRDQGNAYRIELEDASRTNVWGSTDCNAIVRARPGVPNGAAVDAAAASSKRRAHEVLGAETPGKRARHAVRVHA